MKKKLFILSSVLLLSLATFGGYKYYQSQQNKAIASCCDAEGTCSGGEGCTACKNCKYCKHCSKEGGTCSVCK